MPNRKRRRHINQRLATHALELSVAVPQVITHRLTRMATAGLNPSAKDQREFLLMGQEKVDAFYRSWAAMWGHAWQTQMQLASTAMRVGAAMTTGSGAPAAMGLMRTWPTAATGLMAAGLKPIHTVAVANARRLGRQKR